MIDFIAYALAAGVMIAAVAGPLGSFVVWQRLAYFGDTLAHSALLGIALGLTLDLDNNFATLLSCLLLALILVFLQLRPQLATDSLLGILSHGSLAIGLVGISLSDSTRLDLNAYLFGDLLAVNSSDLIIIAIIMAGILIMLWRNWNNFLNLTVNEELTAVEGVNVIALKLILMLMIALLVAVSMKIVGVLLITALLIIPAASARRLARSPEQMAIGATVLGTISVLAGLAGSLQWDTPAGPSIVVAATVLFFLIQCLPVGRQSAG